MKKKTCLTCSIEQPIQNFQRNGYYRNGVPRHKSHCAECQNKKEWLKKHPDKTIEQYKAGKGNNYNGGSPVIGDNKLKNEIRVYKAGVRNLITKVITIPSSFGAEYVVAKTDHLKLIIQKPSMGWMGKTLKVTNSKFSYKCEIYPGKYKIDEEESNEDKIVVYLDSRIKDTEKYDKKSNRNIWHSMDWI